MKFPEFNRVVNPNDEPCYIAVRYGQAPKRMKYDDIAVVAAQDTTLEIRWLIPKGYFVLTTATKEILPTIQSRNENIFVVETPERLIIYCKGKYDRNTTNNILSCGICADTYAHNKNNEVTILLPFKSKMNVSPTLVNYRVVHGTGIGEVPDWLVPIRKISSEVKDGVDLPITSNNKAVLLNILRRIKSLTPTKQAAILELVNHEFSNNPLSDEDLAKLMNISEEQMISQFFDKDKFLHNKMGEYIIKNCNIKRDKISKELFYYNEHEKIYVKDPDYIISYMTRLAPSLKQYQKEEVIKYINAYLYDESVEFNSDPFSIVFKNGVFNLTDASFEPMSADRLESIKIDANYNPNAHSEVVDEFFATATNGNKDIEQLLYEAIGYSMLKTNELQKAFILVGAGRNGKSTYLDILRRLLGDRNVESISFKDASSTFRLSILHNKLASLAGDISNQPIQDSDLIKSIIAGENVTLEEKYKQAFSGKLFSTMFFACNKLPHTPDTTQGFYRRWSIIPFIANLSNVSRVQGLQFKTKLLSQTSIDYVAYKAIQAINRVFTTTEEFTEPKEVIDMLDNYKVANSSVLSWYSKELYRNQRMLTNKTIKELYYSYTAWCETFGRQKVSIDNFLTTIKSDIGVDLEP
jgi:putative DNA primase/helicase